MLLIHSIMAHPDHNVPKRLFDLLVTSSPLRTCWRQLRKKGGKLWAVKPAGVTAAVASIMQGLGTINLG
jgi:hypothetical protein